MLRITAEGGGCSALDASVLLREACVLATFTGPPYIGAAAHGRLNSGHGPAVEALTWRSWFSNRAADCADGGLIDEALAKCEAAVERESYSVRDAGLHVMLGPR